MSEQTNHSEESGISRQDIHHGLVSRHLEKINEEFQRGFELLHKYPKSVSIFGSSLAHSDSPDYLKATELAGRIVKDLGYAIITGGGPGIMEAANKGAGEAGGSSIGLSISLPHEHQLNGYSNQKVHFRYFFARKTMLTFAAEAYVFFPGGYGTFDELFSILTLIQTNKIPRVPIFLYDSKFWNNLIGFFQGTMIEKYHTIDQGDLRLFEITNSIDHIVDQIRQAPVAEWWRNIN